MLTLTNEVKFGETVSYGDLAKLSGSPKAAQAVGSAVSNNPISFVIPCHRVIKSDGTIGNYSKGTKNGVKEWLLNFESPTGKGNKCETDEDEDSESDEDIELSEYEKLRAERVARNAERLKALGLA